MSGRTERAADWMYRGLWGVLVTLFRVPAEPPNLPALPGDHVESFRPAPAYLRYLKFWFWFILLMTDIGFTVAYIASAIALCIAGFWWIALLLAVPALFIIVAPDIVAFIAIHLRFDTTWYVMTGRSLRIRRGIWVITEVTITFENVQNVKVMQGPLQRYFGIADVVVETAGGGGGGKHGHSQSGGGHQGILAGVADASRLRDLILARMKTSRTSGLGDEADEHAHGHGAAAWTREHLGALRQVRDEAAALAAAAT